MVDNKGLKGFEQFYKRQYSEERYNSIVKAFKQPNRYCLILNPLFPPNHLLTHIKTWLSDLESLPNYNTNQGYSKYTQLDKYNLEGYLSPYLKSSKQKVQVPFPGPITDPQTNLQTHYLLDAASLLPVLNLDIQPKDKVLDMCAAPGGKSLVIAFILYQLRTGHTNSLGLERGQLVSNELDKGRYLRLSKVTQGYLSSEHSKTARQRLNDNFQSTKLPPLHTITNLDGANTISLLSPIENQLYDKVLVDAPCSSERHFIQDSLLLPKFKPQNNVNQVQFSLLVSALKLVKVGGTVVYSTCSINHLENDAVLEQLHVRFPNHFELKSEVLVLGDSQSTWCEKTTWGNIVLPDTAFNWGPIFFTKIQRLK